MEINEEDDKKNKVLMIIFLIILISLVSTMTFAMFTFTETGSTENVLVTGNVSIDYEENSVIKLNNQYSMNDSIGISQSGEFNEIKFKIIGVNSSDLTINYAIGIDVIEEGTTLKENYIKVYLLKGDTVVSTFNNGKGRLISEIKPYKVTDVMNDYVMYVDSFTNQGTISQDYTLKAWVSEDYDLSGNGEVRIGDTIKKETTSETFKFKIKVVATDREMTIIKTEE